ncbi:MAG: hypothetical protein K2X87_11860 [Gemmataceae bacterium]|nr:hypothetical protein [Gemmataceae bacterium]
MDRDATPPTPADVLPPVAWETARAVGLAGAGMAAAAAAVGLVAAAAGELPWVANTARLLLVFAGAVTAGLAVSFRPDRWQAWAIGAATAGLAYFGTPPHWDSFRFLFAVAAGVAVALGLLRLLPPGWRLGVVSAYILFHFAGIFLATVSPNPTPWLVEQVYHRVYNPYLQFLYLRNAYHFYSPEPGPASLLACLVKTEVGEEVTADGVRRKKYDTRWVVLPTRPADIRDPMGLTYYRRLCLTEQVARGAYSPLVPQMFEKGEMQERRLRLATPGSDPYYPIVSADGGASEYKLPTPEVTRYVLPAYAQHLIWEQTPDQDAAGRTTVKLYRLEHRTLSVHELTGKGMPGGRAIDPYHPSTYRPFFLGEFDVRGRLVNPQEPLLYWMLPVVPRANPAPGGKDYTDYLSNHAGLEFDWDRLR